MIDKELQKLKAEFKRDRVVGFCYDPTKKEGKFLKKIDGVTIEEIYDEKKDVERIVNNFAMTIIDDVPMVYENYHLSNGAYWGLFIKAFQKYMTGALKKIDMSNAERGRYIGIGTNSLKSSLIEKYGPIDFGVYTEKDNEVINRMQHEHSLYIPRYH